LQIAYSTTIAAMIGKFLQTIINLWIATTGRRIDLSKMSWLDGPTADNHLVGENFYKDYAAKEGLQVTENDPSIGLLQDFRILLDPADPNSHLLNPKIAEFYEHTGQYKLEVWSQWYSFIRPFARLLIQLVSTRMNQLNIPLEPLETSRGMGSEIIRLRDQNGANSLTCWLRKTLKTNRVVYAGFYSACFIPELNRNFVRVVFPLPKGNVTVILRLDMQADGSIQLVSHGKKIGEPGYYRLRKSKSGSIRAKYIPLKEVIHVFEDPHGVLRTDHIFYFWGIKFLHLHYKILDN
jgi:hypothetical protein